MTAPHRTPSLSVQASVAASLAPWANAPTFCCYGCDGERPFEVAFCPSCGELTSGYKADAETFERDAWGNLADHLYGTRRDDAVLRERGL